MPARRNLSQELLKLESSTLPRLKAEEEAARASLLEADAALDSLDVSSYNGHEWRRIEVAQVAVKEAQAWHARAKKALDACERRLARLVILAHSAA